MIALLLALQVAAASTGPLAVKLGDREADVPVAIRDGIEVVRADVLALALQGSLRQLDRQRYELRLGTASIEFTDQVAFARRGEEIIPLATAPFVRDGRLFLPLQVVSEVVPRVLPDVHYVAASRELRRGAAPVAAGGDAAPPPDANGDPPARRAGTPAERAPPAAAPHAAAPRAAAPPRPRAHTVVVDAGHGGPDPGMSGPARGAARIREKDVTLSVAKRYEAALKQRGVNVVMTRTTDTLIALTDRGRIANRAKGDLFVSIHVNAANPRWPNAAAARGFETYFLAEARTDDARHVAEMENSAERFETEVAPTKGDPLGFILTDMRQNEFLRESSNLAEVMQRGLARVHPGPNRGVKQAGFKVLVTAFMPAVLVELGFGTNASDAAFLADARQQERVAQSLADATIEYLTLLDRRSGAIDP